MRIWLIGADQAGSEALQQLKKNPAITVVVSDPAERPKAVTDGIIARVDMVENVTSLNINQLARRIRPDLILIDAGRRQASDGARERRHCLCRGAAIRDDGVERDAVLDPVRG